MKGGRCEFIEARDGKEAAKEFAIRTLRVYRKAILQTRKKGFNPPHHCSFEPFKSHAIKAYIEMKAYWFAS